MCFNQQVITRCFSCYHTISMETNQIPCWPFDPWRPERPDGWRCTLDENYYRLFIVDIEKTIFLYVDMRRCVRCVRMCLRIVEAMLERQGREWREWVERERERWGGVEEDGAKER